MPRRLLLLGGSGQVGTALRRIADPGSWTLTAPTRAELDLADAAALARAVAGVDLVVNCAAHTAVDLAESEPEVSFAANRDGPAALARAAAVAGIPLLHLSTDYVFDGNPGRPWREDDPVSPQGVYARGKEAGERAVREALDRHVIIRTAWVFGPDGKNFLRTMLRLGETRDVLGVVADQWGGPTPADSIAMALERVATTLLDREPPPRDPCWGTFHLAGGPPASWHGFATEIFAQAAARGWRVPPTVSPIGTEQYPTPAKRPSWSVLDCQRIRAVYGVAQPSWKDGIARALDVLGREG